MRECPDRQIISQGIQNKVAQNRAGPVDGALDGLAAFYLDDKRMFAHDGKGLNEEIPAAGSVESRHIFESQLGRAIVHCRGFVNQTATARLLPAIRFHEQKSIQVQPVPHSKSHKRTKRGLGDWRQFHTNRCLEENIRRIMSFTRFSRRASREFTKTAAAILSKDSDRGSFL